MAETVEIAIGAETVFVEAKPLNLIFKHPSMHFSPPLRYPGRVPLDVTVTMYHAEKVKVLHQDFGEAWRLFHASTTPATTFQQVPTADEIRKMDSAAVHLMGLIDMSLKLSDMGVRVVWVRPESEMHPGWQVALADLAIWLMEKYGVKEAT